MNHQLSSSVRLSAIVTLLIQSWLTMPQAWAATVSWVGGSGDWNSPSSWSTGAMPGPGDEVIINQPGDVTVTHSSGEHTVKSIQSQESFVLSGGSLTITGTVQVNNSFRLSGGTLARATVLKGTNGEG